jgi:hypothetical protein
VRRVMGRIERSERGPKTAAIHNPAIISSWSKRGRGARTPRH